jgi:DNA repair exonuclease SbcCD ATPase subunit
MSDSLRSDLIRLAFGKPELRPTLLLLIEKDAAGKKQDKVRAVNRDGKVVWVKKDTLRDQPGKFKPYKYEEDEGKGKEDKAEAKFDGPAWAETPKAYLDNDPFIGRNERRLKEDRHSDLSTKEGIEERKKALGEASEELKKRAKEVDAEVESLLSDPEARENSWIGHWKDDDLKAIAGKIKAKAEEYDREKDDLKIVAYDRNGKPVTSGQMGKKASFPPVPHTAENPLMSDTLRTATIRLAYANPELRAHLLPLLARTAATDPAQVARSAYKDHERDFKSLRGRIADMKKDSSFNSLKAKRDLNDLIEALDMLAKAKSVEDYADLAQEVEAACGKVLAKSKTDGLDDLLPLVKDVQKGAKVVAAKAGE